MSKDGPQEETWGSTGVALSEGAAAEPGGVVVIEEGEGEEDGMQPLNSKVAASAAPKIDLDSTVLTVPPIR